MLNTRTPSCAVALAATFIGAVLSGCVGEVGDGSLDGEGGGPSSGAGVVIHPGDSGSGPSTSSSGSAAAGTGGSSGAATGGAGGSSAQGTGGSATAGAGGSSGEGAGGASSSSAQGTGGAGGAGGSSAEGAGGSSTQGAGGSATASTTAGTGGSSGEGSGSGAGGSGGATGAAQLCVDTINQHRATLGLPPLARWVEAESCSDEEAESDGNTGEFHGAFGLCKESAQNECPGWGGPPDEMIVPCLQLMWDEGPGEDFEKHGHYINMSSTRYTKVACGFHTFPDGSVWAVQNFR
ncbi:CAP domain-containing protein [Sorangium sp. So ce426]|uniref:CAP domain-containing protein n=1 Tax=Sorangium sp. So ce426 TaxID=3133312 RepID=UPI003F5BC54D